jgi:predicted dehydrogenase
MTVVGICGLGSIGRRHARILAELGVDLIVCDPDLDADLAAQLPPGTVIAASVADVLDGGVDGIVIATPDDSHVDIATAACARHIPTLLEKPISDDIATGRHLVERSRSTATPVLVGYVLRHDRTLRRAKELLDARTIGAVASFHVSLGAYETLLVARRRFDSHGYGALFREYSHEFDYLRWLLGPVDGVFAVARRTGSREHQQDPNVVDAVLRLADGTTGTVHLDYLQYPGERRLRLIGDAGSLSVDVAQGVIAVHSDANGSRDEVFPDSRDALFTAQAEHFLAVVSGAEQPCVDARDGLAALAVADAARQSALRMTWVEVDAMTQA